MPGARAAARDCGGFLRFIPALGRLHHPEARCRHHYREPIPCPHLHNTLNATTPVLARALVSSSCISPNVLVRDVLQSSMQAESKLHDEVVEVYKAVKLLCAQYHVGQHEMRDWMEAINAFDQYGHGFISTDQVRALSYTTRPLVPTRQQHSNAFLQQAARDLVVCVFVRLAGRWCGRVAREPS